MITADLLDDILSSLNEKIPLCRELVNHGQCEWNCCLKSDSYILFLPGEWESAIALGYEVAQYEILDESYFGGKKVDARQDGCCSAAIRGSRAYKSLDCRLYPYWFQIEGILQLIHALSCPIIQLGRPIESHREQAVRVAEKLMGDPDVREFFRNARMVNYGPTGSHSSLAHQNGSH
ncbi:hypothetical protein [Actinomadura sp. 9N215]|uniref:hypothetical protein n=1 Tax=Actinomadura sp. 9N215 TaxID=3375150 RepID=UPI0037939022